MSYSDLTRRTIAPVISGTKHSCLFKSCQSVTILSFCLSENTGTQQLARVLMVMAFDSNILQFFVRLVGMLRAAQCMARNIFASLNADREYSLKRRLLFKKSTYVG